MIRTKSVHSPIDRQKDGLRILATRGHGRGSSANRYDVWMANLGPSEELMDAARNKRITWAEKRIFAAPTWYVLEQIQSGIWTYFRARR